MARARPLATLLAVLGALGIGFSAYIDWLGDRAPDEVPLRRLWDGGVTAEASSYWRSLALPLVIASVVGLFGAVLGSRAVLGLAFLGAVVTLVWYLIREYDLRDGLDGTDMPGAWVLMGSLVLLLVGILAMGPHPAPDDPRRLVARPGT